jgi:hypothetical protein
MLAFLLVIKFMHQCTLVYLLDLATIGTGMDEPSGFDAAFKFRMGARYCLACPLYFFLFVPNNATEVYEQSTEQCPHTAVSRIKNGTQKTVTQKAL